MKFRREDGSGIYLHSRENPEEEARMLVQDVPLRERTMYLVLGFGLGYHVKELLKRIPQSSQVTVIESPRACLSAMQAHGRKLRDASSAGGERLHFLNPDDPEMVPILLADRVARQRLLALELFTHAPSTMTDESFYRKLLDLVPRQFPGSFSIHLASLDKLLENDLSNFWANLPQSWDAAAARSLKDQWSGRPLVIVSAGPSLNDALPLLQNPAGDRLLLATAPTAGILLANRIRPDLVISLDPFEENAAHFRGWEEAGIPLVYYHRISRHVLNVHKGPRFVFTMRDEPPLPLKNSTGGSEFRRGGSVAFSALQLAHLLGANPIILAGQDFAFAGGHTHARGSAADRTFEEDAPPAEFFHVQGVDGRPVATNRLYHSYRIYLQNYLAEYARKKPAVKHINISKTGARIEGTDSMDAERALAFGPAADAEDAAIRNAATLARSRRITPKARSAALTRWCAEVDRLLRRPDGFENFPALFSAFRGTSLCAQAPRSYDDVHYLYEARYRATDDAFLRRFLDHLRFVADTLNKANHQDTKTPS